MKFNKLIVFFIIFFVSLFGCLLITQPILAQIGGTGSYDLPNPLTATTFEDLVNSIATWFELIMVPIATIMILYAAFLFMTSGGDEEKIKRAKRAITWAVVGVAIVLIGAGFITLIKSFLSK